MQVFFSIPAIWPLLTQKELFALALPSSLLIFPSTYLINLYFFPSAIVTTSDVINDVNNRFEAFREEAIQQSLNKGFGMFFCTCTSIFQHFYAKFGYRRISR